MNAWKPIGMFATAGLVASLGIQIASASKGSDATPIVGEGPCHNQPHMANAKGYLEKARDELGLAESDKGNWRAGAIQSIRSVLDQVNNGCNYAAGR